MDQCLVEICVHGVRKEDVNSKCALGVWLQQLCLEFTLHRGGLNPKMLKTQLIY